MSAETAMSIIEGVNKLTDDSKGTSLSPQTGNTSQNSTIDSSSDLGKLLEKSLASETSLLNPSVPKITTSATLDSFVTSANNNGLKSVPEGLVLIYNELKKYNTSTDDVINKALSSASSGSSSTSSLSSFLQDLTSETLGEAISKALINAVTAESISSLLSGLIGTAGWAALGVSLAAVLAGVTYNVVQNRQGENNRPVGDVEAPDGSVVTPTAKDVSVNGGFVSGTYNLYTEEQAAKSVDDFLDKWKEDKLAEYEAKLEEAGITAESDLEAYTEAMGAEEKYLESLITEEYKQNLIKEFMQINYADYLKSQVDSDSTVYTSEQLEAEKQSLLELFSSAGTSADLFTWLTSVVSDINSGVDEATKKGETANPWADNPALINLLTKLRLIEADATDSAGHWRTLYTEDTIGNLDTSILLPAWMEVTGISAEDIQTYLQEKKYTVSASDIERTERGKKEVAAREAARAAAGSVEAEEVEEVVEPVVDTIEEVVESIVEETTEIIVDNIEAVGETIEEDLINNSTSVFNFSNLNDSNTLSLKIPTNFFQSGVNLFKSTNDSPVGAKNPFADVDEDLYSYIAQVMQISPNVTDPQMIITMAQKLKDVTENNPTAVPTTIDGTNPMTALRAAQNGITTEEQQAADKAALDKLLYGTTPGFEWAGTSAQAKTSSITLGIGSWIASILPNGVISGAVDAISSGIAAAGDTSYLVDRGLTLINGATALTGTPFDVAAKSWEEQTTGAFETPALDAALTENPTDNLEENSEVIEGEAAKTTAAATEVMADNTGETVKTLKSIASQLSALNNANTSSGNSYTDLLGNSYSYSLPSGSFGVTYKR